MSVPEVIVDPRVIEELTEEGLIAALTQLWPVDCVSCGEPLGTDPPGLWVTTSAPGFIVALCHPACAPEFGETPLFIAGTSWLMHCFVSSGTPVAVLNPSAERLAVERSGKGWRVRPDHDFSAAGFIVFQPGGFRLNRDEPLRIEPLRLTADRVEVTLGGSRYGTPVSPGVAGAIREHGGLLLIVSHAIWAEGDLADLVAKGQAAVGWAALDAAADRILTEALTAVTEAIDRTVAPPMAPRGRRLLWLAPGEWSVVVLLASAPAANEEQAQAWGTGSLRSGTSSLPWRGWNADAVIHRWQTRDALTTIEFDLLFDGSHARVYQRLAYGKQPDGIEDGHLFAWAQRVLGGTSRWERLASTGPRNHWWGEVTP